MILEEPTPEHTSLDYCQACGNKIEIMIRRHTGICSENCEKAREGQTFVLVDPNHPATLKGRENGAQDRQ